MTFLERGRSLLASPRAPVGVAALGVGLAMSSLGAGLQTEDYVHRHAVGLASFGANLFGGRVTPMEAYGLKDAGLLPWITVDDWSLAFFRPLTAWTHVLDYVAWPDLPWLVHAHSLVWFGVLLYVVAVLHRRLVGGAAWAAGLAGLLYAIDDGHGPAVGWIANRSAVIATALATLALVAHDRWRREGWRPGALVAPLTFAAALAAGEVAAGMAGFFVAYAIFVETGSWRSRIASAAGWATVAAGWMASYRILGYGARGSAAYVDPFSNPKGFATAVVERFPLLLQGLFGAPSTDFVVVMERWERWFITSGAVMVIASLFAIASVLRHDRRARFWAAGTLLALLPACTALPADRLLFVAGIGAMALLASTVHAVAAATSRGLSGTGWFTRATLAAWALVHGVSAPALLPWRAMGLREHDEWIRVQGEAAFERLPPPDGQLVIVNTPDFYTGALLVAVRAALGRPAQGRVRVLYGGDQPVRVSRLNDTTLEVRPSKGFMVPSVNTVYRSAQRPLWVGTGIQLTGMQVIVTEADRHGAPVAAAFRFDRPLESDGLVFVAWDGASYVQWAPPRAGSSIEVPGIELEAF